MQLPSQMDRRARQEAERQAYARKMSLEGYLSSLEAKEAELARWEKMRMDAPDKAAFDKQSNPYLQENWGITANEQPDKTGSLMWSESQEREQQAQQAAEKAIAELAGPVVRGVGLRGRQAVPVSGVPTTSKVAYIPQSDQSANQSSPLRGMTTRTGTVRKPL